MKKQVALVFIFIFILILISAGCKQVHEGNTSAEDSYTIVNAPESDIDALCPTEAEDTYILPGLDPQNSIIFDFDIFSEDIFPRGFMTVNQLIDIYGKPERTGASNHSGYVMIFVEYKNMLITFVPEHMSTFSFYDDALKDEYVEEGRSFELNEEDKNIELDIMSVRIISANILLPHGLRVGESTRKQVLDVYPIDAGYQERDEWEMEDGSIAQIDWLFFYYGFRNEKGELPVLNARISDGIFFGEVMYSFDENEILKFVEITWKYRFSD